MKIFLSLILLACLQISCKGDPNTVQESIDIPSVDMTEEAQEESSSSDTIITEEYKEEEEFNKTEVIQKDSMHVKPKSVPKPEVEPVDDVIGKVKIEKTKIFVKEQAKPLTDHSKWDQLLSKHVSSTGQVNYKAFKYDEEKLDSYLSTLSGTDLSPLNRNEQLAFWINAYNAFTIKKILANYPVNSITDLDNGKPWDVKWIKLNGTVLSLNQIENEIIRPTFNEPRIHFAVNCAASSCPPLMNKAWTGDNLKDKLNSQTKAFINNKNYNEISSSSIKVSKIFDWYRVDFGNLIEFLNKYSSIKIDSDAKIEFKEYNWALN